MKKIISLLMLFAMLLTALPAIADGVKTSGDFQYTIKGNGTATIVGYTGEKGKDIIIPNLLDGYPITAIGDSAFVSISYTTRINATIPDTITSIGEKAFLE